MSDSVGVGIVGAGYWGTKLAKEYLELERTKGNVKLLKVCDSSLSALLSCRKKTSIDNNLLTQNLRDLIEDSDISAVHIATPNHTHYTLARMVLQAGKDAIVEKPMTLNSRDAYELADLAASRGLVLHVGHIFRFNSALQMAREVMKSGIIGKIFYARVQWTDSSHFPDRNIIFDLGPHPIDVLNQLLDSWPIQVSGFARAFRNSKEHSEVAYGVAEFHDGVFAHVELSWLSPGKVRTASVIGSEGAIVVDCLAQRLIRYDADGSEELPVTANNTIASEIDWFIDCVSKRRTSIESALIGARTVQVLEAMCASMSEESSSTVELSRPIGYSRMPQALEVAGNRPKKDLLTRKSESNSNAGLGKYVELLLRAGLVRDIGTWRRASYQITDAGLRFLMECHALSGVSESIPAPLRREREVQFLSRRLSKTEVLSRRREN